MPDTAGVSPSGNQDIDGLLSDTKWTANTFTFSFPTGASFYEYDDGGLSTFGVLSPGAQSMVRAILQMYAAVANLTFTEVTESVDTHADLRYADNDVAVTAYAYLPSDPERGDSWYQKTGFYGAEFDTPVKGNYGFLGYIHETGHMLGLKHGHETDTYGALPFDHDSMEYSVMTYRSYVGASTTAGYTNEDWGYAQTLMMDDIAALQYLYGANFNTNSGDTTYTWDPSSGQPFVNGAGGLTTGMNIIFMTLWDGNGVDTYDLSNYATNLTIDLSPGGFSVFSTNQLALLDSDGSQVARGNVFNSLQYQDDPRSLIENATGGSGNDTITGNSTANTLVGGGGSDALDGLGGPDTIVGGPDNDIISGGEGADTLSGGDGDDVIYGYGASDEAANAGAINATRVATGFNGAVFLTSAPNDANHVFVLTKDNGVIAKLDPQTSIASVFLDIPDNEFSSGGEEGVLGLAFHPQYATNGRFFVFLTTPSGDLEVREYTRSAGDPNIADPGSARTILTIPHPTNSNHNGGFIGFGPDGYLYISTGDGGGAGDPDENAQDTSSLLGKILRIDINSDQFPGDPALNYANPGDNPFVGTAGADEVWAYGLRNPWRISFDTATGDLYIGDVGQDRIEEVDYQPAEAPGGRNYGWDINEGSLPFEPNQPGEPPPNDPSLIDPIFEYGRELGQTITGGYVYHGPGEGLQDAYIVADFLSHRFWSLRVEDGVAVDAVERTQQIVSSAGTPQFISSFGVDGNGQLYAVSLFGDIWRLDPTEGAGDVGDTLMGDAGNDRLYGGVGDDALQGGSGNDQLSGGFGSDTLIGGTGIDRGDFDSVLVNHTVVRNGVLTTVSSQAGTDRLSSIETLHFSNVDLRNIFFTGNFDGGVSGDDIALQNGSDTAFWLMDGTAIQAGSGNLPTLGSGWTAIGAGDLSGNGTDDLVLQNGQDLALWQMSGTAVSTGSGNIGTLGAGWMVTGIADLSGDGNDDLVLQNGQTLAVWQMTGTTIGPGSGNIGTLGAGWAVAGTGDFNDDGTDDLLLQNGQNLAVWHMNGTTILGTSGNIGTLGSGWLVAGVADTNGDDQADVLLQNGQDLAVWLMDGNGTTILPASGNIGTLGSGWTIAGNGDFNHDGMADLLLQNGSTLAEWHLNGTTILGTSGNVGTLGAGWDLL